MSGSTKSDMNGIAHDAIMETNNVIETPSWRKYTTPEQMSESSDEDTDDEMYSKLHVHFEECERRRYVLSAISGTKPFCVPLSALQFMKIHPTSEEILPSYKYPPPHEVHTRNDVLKYIDSSLWTASPVDAYSVHFKAN